MFSLISLLCIGSTVNFTTKIKWKRDAFRACALSPSITITNNCSHDCRLDDSSPLQNSTQQFNLLFRFIYQFVSACVRAYVCVSALHLYRRKYKMRNANECWCFALSFFFIFIAVFIFDTHILCYTHISLFTNKFASQLLKWSTWNLCSRTLEKLDAPIWNASIHF